MNLRKLLLTAGAVIAFSPIAQAKEGVAFKDEATAGPDFKLQGEYEGQVDVGEGPQDYGVQIIARGNGKFKLVAFVGGLPGKGWNRGDEQLETDGEVSDGKLFAEVEGAEIQVTDGMLNVIADGTAIGALKKVHRQSPTRAKDAPEGAIVLFKGKSVNNFEGGKLENGKWLAATSVESKEKFGDHHLHIEFRTPFMPAARGQGRGNSGVYIQGRYELQVLDSFGLDGKNNECGGFYQIAEPKVNMCYPPLSWQTYDIDFTAAKYDVDGKKIKNARATVVHNGVVIHDDLELPNGTPGHDPEGPEENGLFLQDHNNPVVFRNIWVVKK